MLGALDVFIVLIVTVVTVAVVVVVPASVRVGVVVVLIVVVTVGGIVDLSTTGLDDTVVATTDFGELETIGALPAIEIA